MPSDMTRACGFCLALKLAYLGLAVLVFTRFHACLRRQTLHTSDNSEGWDPERTFIAGFRLRFVPKDNRERLLDAYTIYVLWIFAWKWRESDEQRDQKANRYVHMEMMKIYHSTSVFVSSSSLPVWIYGVTSCSRKGTKVSQGSYKSEPSVLEVNYSRGQRVLPSQFCLDVFLNILLFHRSVPTCLIVEGKRDVV
jgi:hypothetical protein